MEHLGRPGRLGRRAWGAFVVVVAAAIALLPLPAETVERTFSVVLYPPVQRVATGISNLVPVAFLDILLALTLFWLVRLLLWTRTRAHTTGWPGALTAACGRLVVMTAGLYLCFALVWGLNYRRVPLVGKLEVEQRTIGPADLERLGRRAVSELNALHDRAHARGWSSPEWRSSELVEAAGRVQVMLGAARAATPGRLKHSILGPYFRWTSIDGMINPFGLDVLVNPDLLPYERPFVAAHEWAHLAGYADESEASFVGFLTCMSGGAPAQYSGYLFLYWQVASDADPAVRRLIDRALADGPRADVQAIVTRVETGRFQGLQRASWGVYDQYLKANRVEAGVRSYGLVLDLLARATSQTDWTVRRRDALGREVSRR